MPLRSPQTILVTGASQGIGRELALQLAAQGHTVIAWARTQTLLESLQNDRIKTYVVDLSDTDALALHVSELLNTYPSLSGVIHNAAIQNEPYLIDSTREKIRAEIAINLTAPIVLTQALLPHLMNQNNAFICNITSVLALAAKRHSAVYCASKAGLHIFSNSLRAQLVGTGIQLTEVMPPTVETRMTAHRNVPKMSADSVANQTIKAIKNHRSTVILGKGRLIGVALYLVPWLIKKIMLRF
jgi:uncharacterized oxidoreductase